MKQLKYTVARPDGRLERIRCPQMFTPYEVANRLPHSIVFMAVPEGSSVFGDGPDGSSKISGPATVVIDYLRAEFVWVSEAPLNGGHAFSLWAQFGGPARQARHARKGRAA